MNLGDMKFYLYRSKSKIDMLYSQLQQPKPTKIKWKIDLKAISRENEAASSEITVEQKLQSVLAELEEQELVGSIEDDKPYIKAILPVRWGLYNDDGIRDLENGHTVYFGSTNDQFMLGMPGSSHHIEGHYGITSTSSRSATPWVAEFFLRTLQTGERPSHYEDLGREEMHQVYEGLALANHYLKGPVQDVEFVAKVICRDQHCKLRPWRPERGEGIIATPLYVAQIHPMAEDDDPPRTD